MPGIRRGFCARSTSASVSASMPQAGSKNRARAARPKIRAIRAIRSSVCGYRRPGGNRLLGCQGPRERARQVRLKSRIVPDFRSMAECGVEDPAGAVRLRPRDDEVSRLSGSRMTIVGMMIERQQNVNARARVRFELVKLVEDREGRRQRRGRGVTTIFNREICLRLIAVRVELGADHLEIRALVMIGRSEEHT